jgi:hypothetical protein
VVGCQSRLNLSASAWRRSVWREDNSPGRVLVACGLQGSGILVQRNNLEDPIETCCCTHTFHLSAALLLSSWPSRSILELMSSKIFSERDARQGPYSTQRPELMSWSPAWVASSSLDTKEWHPGSILVFSGASEISSSKLRSSSSAVEASFLQALHKEKTLC